MAPFVDGLRARGLVATAIDLPKRKAEDALPAFHRSSRSAPDVVVGGHSYGGRVASLAAAEPDAPYAALVLFSYPLHPPGAPERTDARIAHWPAIRCPVLLLSGESDPFARIELLRAAVPRLPHGGARHLPAARAHAQAGPRRRPGSRRRPSCRGARGRPSRWSVGSLAPVAEAYPDRTPDAARPRRPASLRRSRPPASQPPIPDPLDARRAHRVVPVGRSSIASPVTAASAVLVDRRDDHRPAVGHRSRRPRWPSDPPGLASSWTPSGSVESGGDYRARNRVSGAYGKYQIMPSSWPAWAERYLGDAQAPSRRRPTRRRWPRRSSRALYHWLGTLASRRLLVADRLVEADVGWSTRATRYVTRVMRYYDGSRRRRRRPGTPTREVRPRSPSGDGRDRRTRGRGRPRGIARTPASAVKYATARRRDRDRSRSRASKITWYGPVGPTRGKARVSIDGTVVKTVDLHRTTFDARAGRVQPARGRRPATTR